MLVSVKIPKNLNGTSIFEFHETITKNFICLFHINVEKSKECLIILNKRYKLGNRSYYNKVEDKNNSNLAEGTIL